MSLPLRPESVGALLTSASWHRLEGGGETGSTNDDCKALARDGAEEGTVVLAAAQHAGRGRLGRPWTSPPGGVYLSMLLRPPLAAAEAGPLSLVVALGAARGLAHHLAIGLKWPNDLVTEGGKLGGVLLESSGEGERLSWVVAGCGVNVEPPAEADRLPGAAYLAEVSRTDAGLEAVAAALLDGVAEAYAEFLADGFASLRDEYERRSVLAGRDVTVSRPEGDLVAQGVVRGVDEDGRLLLEGPSGLVPVESGEATIGTSSGDAR